MQELLLRPIQKVVRAAPLFRGKHRLSTWIDRRFGIPDQPGWARLPNGARMLVTDWTRSYFWYLGVYEPEVTHIFMRILRRLSPGDSVIDLGANQGYYTLLAARHLQSLNKPGKGDKAETKAKVFAFEPHPEAFAWLRSNVELNRFDNVVCEQLAIADKSGQASLHWSEIDVAWSSLKPVMDEFSRSSPVKVVSLDEYFDLSSGGGPASESNGSAGAPTGRPRGRRIGLIKMDIQGGELPALLGAERLLGADRPVIIMEEWPAGMRRFGYDVSDVKDFLRRLGYDYYTVHQGRLRWATLRKAHPRHADCSYRDEDFTTLLCVPQLG